MTKVNDADVCPACRGIGAGVFRGTTCEVCGQYPPGPPEVMVHSDPEIAKILLAKARAKCKSDD